MTAPTISDKVYNACWKVYSKNGDSLEKALLEYDRLVCEPLRSEIAFMLDEDKKWIGILSDERDAALKLVEELKKDKARLDWSDRIRYLRETFKEF